MSSPTARKQRGSPTGSKAKKAPSPQQLQSAHVPQSHRDRALVYTHSTVFEPLRKNENVNIYGQDRQKNILMQREALKSSGNKKNDPRVENPRDVKQTQLRGAGSIFRNQEDTVVLSRGPSAGFPNNSGKKNGKKIISHPSVGSDMSRAAGVSTSAGGSGSELGEGEGSSANSSWTTSNQYRRQQGGGPSPNYASSCPFGVDSSCGAARARGVAHRVQTIAEKRKQTSMKFTPSKRSGEPQSAPVATEGSRDSGGRLSGNGISGESRSSLAMPKSFRDLSDLYLKQNGRSGWTDTRTQQVHDGHGIIT